MNARRQLRILYASERPPFPFFLGGAARSAHYVLGELTRSFAAHCRALGSARFTGGNWSCPTPDDYPTLGVTAIETSNDSVLVDCGYQVEVAGDFLRRLEALIDSFKPDALWAQLDGSEAVLRVGREKGVPTVYFMRDADLTKDELKAISATGAHIICNSAFLAERVSEISGKRAAFIHPTLDTPFQIRGDADGYLTMINAHRVKGLDTFLELARLMPDERFLLVESWPLDERALRLLNDRLQQRPNVVFRRRVSDMRQIYGRTKLLLVPSVCEEAFGRVAIEAESCAIPVIASARGGLPESVGDGGLLVREYQDVRAWMKTIRRLLNDRTLYATLSQRALKHGASKNFTRGYAARCFYDICSSLSPQGAVHVTERCTSI